VSLRTSRTSIPVVNVVVDVGDDGAVCGSLEVEEEPSQCAIGAIIIRRLTAVTVVVVNTASDPNNLVR
jgi:hypothetical protein